MASSTLGAEHTWKSWWFSFMMLLIWLNTSSAGIRSGKEVSSTAWHQLGSQSDLQLHTHGGYWHYPLWLLSKGWHCKRMGSNSLWSRWTFLHSLYLLWNTHHGFRQSTWLEWLNTLFLCKDPHWNSVSVLSHRLTPITAAIIKQYQHPGVIHGYHCHKLSLKYLRSL